MSSWPRVQISEVCELIVDCVNKTAPRVEYETPYKMIRTPNIKNGRVDRNGCRYVEKATFDKWTRRAKVLRGDVLLTREAPMGQVGFIDFDDTIFLGQRIMQYRANPELLDSEFLLYTFLSTDLKHQFHMHEGSGSVVSHIRVPDCLKFELNLPPLEEQKRIAKVLRDLDNKINLNRQTNETLEEIAQAIFKSWFVDFDPTRAKIAAKENGHDLELAAMAAIAGKSIDELDTFSDAQLGNLKSTAALFPDKLVESELGEIPEGWEVALLGDFLEFNPKRILKKGTLSPYLDMKNLPTKGHLVENVYLREMASGTKFINGDTLFARITPCLENGKTAYVDFLKNDQVAWGSTEYIVIRPKQGYPLSLGYIIARLDSFRAKAIQSMTGTSGRQRANAKTLSEQPWIKYPQNLLNHFDLIAGAYLKKAKANGVESQYLAELRDTLLPKLLSGELDIQTDL
jgi:type I restriction enzyme S subunit